MTTKSFKYFLSNYFLGNFLYNFVFAYAIYNLFMSVNGLSVFQISVLLCWWSITCMAFEIPSGALADWWDYRKLLIISPIIKSLCFIIWIFANGNFYLFALGYLFWSLAAALFSGTNEAYLYDGLSFYDKSESFSKIFGYKKALYYLSIATGILFGGIIANFNINFAIIYSAIPLLFSSFFAYLLPKIPKIKKENITIKYLDHYKIALKEIKSNKTLLILIIYSLGLSILGSTEEFDQLYYELVKLPIFAFGIVGFIWSLLNSIGSLLAYKIQKYNFVIYLLPLISAFLMFFVGLRPGKIMIIPLLVSYFIISPLIILNDIKIQNSIKSSSRATIISVESFLINFLGALFLPIFGLMGNLTNLRYIYYLTSFLLVILFLWSFVNRKIINQQNEF